MSEVIGKVLVSIPGKDKTFNGDELTSAVQQAILYLKELEKGFFDE